MSRMGIGEIYEPRITDGRSQAATRFVHLRLNGRPGKLMRQRYILRAHRIGGNVPTTSPLGITSYATTVMLVNSTVSLLSFLSMSWTQMGLVD